MNAAGNGKKWHNATGWCCYTYYGHSLSDELATCLYKAARHHLPGHKLRTNYSDGDPDLSLRPGTKRCRGFLYFEVSISDNSPSNYFGNFILLRFLIRFYMNIC